MRRERKLCFENLERRLVRTGDLSLNVEAQGHVFSSTTVAQLQTGSELNFDIRFLNESQKSYDSALVRIDTGDGIEIQAEPRLVEAVPPESKLATFKMGALRFLAHPSQPYVFATIDSSSSLAIFNTETLKLEAAFFVGSRPYGLALSNDGNTLYVANSSSNFVAIVDWRARRVTGNLRVSGVPYDIEVGKDGRLYVLTNQKLIQIDPNSGTKVGPDFPCRVYSGELAISSKKDRLYYGDFGLSPASLYQFDLTTPSPTLLWESDHGITSGDNGQAVAISPDGSFVSYATGYGQIGYRIAKYRTSDMAIEGSFETGAYPSEITFSPDGKTAYAMHSSEQIDVFDTTTFVQIASINTNFEQKYYSYDLMVDSSGQKIFATDRKVISIFRANQEPRYVNVGDTNQNGKLDPNEAWIFSAKNVALPAKHIVRAVGSARSSDGPVVSVELAGAYIGIASPSFRMQFHDYVVQTPEILAGESVQYDFALENSSSVHFGNVRIAVDNGTPSDPTDDVLAAIVSGDSNNDRLLGPGERWQLSAKLGAKRGRINVASSFAADLTDRFGVRLLGQIPARQVASISYVGAAPEVKVRIIADGIDVSAADLLFAEVGSEITTKIFASNTGNVALSNVRIKNESPTDDSLQFESVMGAPSKRGDRIGQFSELGGRVKFLADASRNQVYVSIFDQNIVAVLDVATLRIIERIPVGAGPTQMALSQDSQILYVASSAAKQVSRIDLRTRTAMAPFVFTDEIYDVKVGADRLYVLTGDSLFQVNQSTGVPTGQSVPNLERGEMEISSDSRYLYLSTFGSSPLSLAKYELNGDKITLVDSRSDYAWFGQDLALSHNGKFVAVAAVVGQYGDKIAQYSTANMQILGSFDTGPSPHEIVYGTDDSIAFTVAKTNAYPSKIQAWDTMSFKELFSIDTPSFANELIVSPDGKILIASFEDALRIYDLNKRMRFNIGDLNWNNQLDVGEAWQYFAKSSVSIGKHLNSTSVSSSFDRLDVQNTSTVNWGYEGVVGATFVSENVKGAFVRTVAQRPVTISDNRVEFKDGAIYLREDSFFQFSDEPVPVQLTFADQSQTSFNVYIRTNPYPWHNAAMVTDVDQDLKITPLDVLQLVNEINLNGVRSLGTRHRDKSTLFDVDADGMISPLDVLLVVNEINRRGADFGGGEGEQSYPQIFWEDYNSENLKRRKLGTISHS